MALEAAGSWHCSAVGCMRICLIQYLHTPWDLAGDLSLHESKLELWKEIKKPTN